MTPPGEGYSVRFIDVSDALLSATATGVKQYFKTDSHWNPEGGWTAYQAMMDQLLPEHPNLHRLTEDDIVRSEMIDSGDLAALIGQQGINPDKTSSLQVKNSHIVNISDENSGGYESFRNESLPDGPKMLLIGDSFRAALLPFLLESVSQLDLMASDSPALSSVPDLSVYDIVIYEVVERNRFWLFDGLELEGEAEEEEGQAEEYEGDDEGEYEGD